MLCVMCIRRKDSKNDKKIGKIEVNKHTTRLNHIVCFGKAYQAEHLVLMVKVMMINGLNRLLRFEPQPDS